MMQVQYRIHRPGIEPENVFVLKSGEDVVLCSDEDLQQGLSQPEIKATVTVDGQLCSLYFNVLKNEAARRQLLEYLRRTYRKKRFLFDVNVVEPKKHILDWKGSEMFERSALERREVDRALAWFSTLGGAFSALGDSMTDCAIVAGKISTRQFKLALRLGDPTLMARCRLYMALSLIQQKAFKTAKAIVKNEYVRANEQIVKDYKLISMCQGIWVKLKYDRARHRCHTTNKQEIEALA